MIKKLRRQFVIVIMAVVAVLMMIAFVGVWVSTSSNLEHENQFALGDALQRMSGPGNREDKPGVGPGGGLGNRSMPIITVVTDSAGAIVKFSNQIFNFSDSDVAAISSQALAQGESSGILKSYNLRFLIQGLPDGSARLAFVDNSMETHVIQNLLKNSAIIGASTLLLFFAVSILLSHWVVRPVEKAWNNQRQFIADASHELKTPLTVILSNAGMLSNEHENGDDKTKTRLGNILAEAKRMKILVDDLLTLARSDEADGKSRFENVDFSALLQNTALSFEPIVFEMGKRFDYKIEDLLCVSGDPLKLRQLAEILLDNACKYSKPGSSIKLNARTISKSEIYLEIENESEMIPKEELGRIFERFYRLDKSRSSSGYGLGLSIAFAVVREHDGKIWATSEKGRVVFYIQLPCCK